MKVLKFPPFLLNTGAFPEPLPLKEDRSPSHKAVHVQRDSRESKEQNKMFEHLL
jgi:hypothetical protein